ncbi:hypothetical protein IJH16_01415 [Candidatus Saccharibacteria bacterium]|nr:hypothetical protein [Candidatus Saccharibacteria bacterium]MBR5408819.1 hypothetical protein [Candidatus Saccharibacteria bacterium]
MQNDNTWVIALVLAITVPVLLVGNVLDKRYGHGRLVEDHPITASLSAIPFFLIMLIFDFGWISISTIILYVALILVIYLLNRKQLLPVKKGEAPVKAANYFVLAPIVAVIYLLILSKLV